MSQTDKNERFKKELHRLWGMHLSRDYKVSRRDLMKGMMGLGLSATAISMIMRKAPFGIKKAWAAEGDTPEQRAIIAAKALYANSPKKTISIMHPSGSGGNMSPFSAEWKELTGFEVELIFKKRSLPHAVQAIELFGRGGIERAAFKICASVECPLSLEVVRQSQ